MKKPDLVLAALAIVAVLAAQGSSTSTAQVLSDVRAMQMTGPTTGWVLTAQRLARTDDAGATWRAITPGGVAATAVLAVFFLDVSRGWLVERGTQESNAPGRTQLHAHRTTDGGATWTRASVGATLYGAPGRTQTHFGDASRGAITVSLEGSFALSPAQAFTTTDGGATWISRGLPARGEPTATGRGLWLSAGRGGAYDLFQSGDEGATWAARGPSTNGSRGRAVFGSPRFFGDVGVVIVAWASDAAPALGAYLSTDGGMSWSLAFDHATPEPVTAGFPIPSAVFDATNWLAMSPSAERVVRVSDQGRRLDVIKPVGLPAGILQVSFANSANGWALQSTTGSGRLFATSNGGRNWRELLP